MMQIKSEKEQRILEYIIDLDHDPNVKDIMKKFDQISSNEIKEILTKMVSNDILFRHNDGTYTLNNPDFDPSKHAWVVLD